MKFRELRRRVGKQIHGHADTNGSVGPEAKAQCIPLKTPKTLAGKEDYI